MTDEEIGIGNKETPEKSSATFDSKKEEAKADEGIDIGGAPEKPSATIDSKKEEAKFELEQKSDERSERLRRNMLWVAIIFFWILSTILAIAVSFFAWHKLTPDHWGFLSLKQIDSMQTFLLSGALTAFLSSVGRNMVKLYKGEN